MKPPPHARHCKAWSSIHDLHRFRIGFDLHVRRVVIEKNRLNDRNEINEEAAYEEEFMRANGNDCIEAHAEGVSKYSLRP